MNLEPSKLRPALLLLVVLLLSGCRLQVDVGVAGDPDGGGTLEVSATTDAELEQTAREAGVDPLGRLVDRVAALDGPWDVDEQVDDTAGTRSVTLSRGFEPGGFAAAYEELRAALDAPEGRVLGPLDVAVDPETALITVEGTLPLEVTDVAAADLGTDVAALTEQLTGVVGSSLTITTPGPLVDGSVQGDPEVVVEDQPAAVPYPDAPATLTWRVDPGTTAQVGATFEPGGSPLVTILLYAGGAVVAVGLVAGGVWAQRRR
ncbi:hypothetical protein [Euzebya sp.]|uniref:hypothetical protein n=1 Tax=Euzebya sp. TaxID=1971409 RepID=UPI0035123904